MTVTLRAVTAGTLIALTVALSPVHAAEPETPAKTEAPAAAAPVAVTPAKPAAPARPTAAAKPPAKTEAKPEAAAPAVMPGVPAPKALPPEIAGECAWSGKRVVSLLARDDVDQAKRFLEFYRLFECKESHLAVAFRCVIIDDGTATEEFSARVDRCWAAFN